ncbi:hypothetical protein NP493_5812g00000, partial [Ridgeia piscesae]
SLPPSPADSGVSVSDHETNEDTKYRVTPVSSAGAYTATSVVTPTFCQMSVAMSNHHTRPVGHFSHDAHIAMRPGLTTGNPTDLTGYPNHPPFHHQPPHLLGDSVPMCQLPVTVAEAANGADMHHIDGLPMHIQHYQQHSPPSGADTDTYSCSQSGMSDSESLPSRTPKSGKGRKPKNPNGLSMALNQLACLPASFQLEQFKVVEDRAPLLGMDRPFGFFGFRPRKTRT